MKIIDPENWPRREAFAHFSRADYPFYSVVVPLDVTALLARTRREGLSFYYAMIWLCTAAVNAVPAFRQRVRGDQVVELEHTEPSFTDLHKGAEQFHIVTLPWEADLREFCCHAAEKSAAQRCFLAHDDETDGLIYFSCLPWFDFTALTNEHLLDRDDTEPRLTWGRYCEENGRVRLHLSIEVNHRLIDGLHIGRLCAEIERRIAEM